MYPPRQWKWVFGGALSASDFIVEGLKRESFRDELSHYLDSSQQALGQIDQESVALFTEKVIDAWRDDRQLIVFGNGGSAATASHLAEDLATYAIPFSESKRLRVISLNDSPSIITALGNDIDFESIFAEQVQQWARPGDLVLTMSGSGNSPNLVAAIERARGIGCQTAAMTGFDGGKLRQIVDLPLHVEVAEMQPAQDAHMVMTHMIIHGFRVAVRSVLAERATGRPAT
ncbi:MAG: SIS domain-containing protein [Planctomycetota bacterium]|nr:hypothetical protein [Planctomycetota bacterium]MEE2882909.1 SIS domain-containing protein [Planctomycetota bacterium]